MIMINTQEFNKSTSENFTARTVHDHDEYWRI